MVDFINRKTDQNDLPQLKLILERSLGGKVQGSEPSDLPNDTSVLEALERLAFLDISLRDLKVIAA